jgi:hypothetical protein
MSNKSIATIATMGIDIGKNSFHVVGLNQRGAIVLRQKCSLAAPQQRTRYTGQHTGRGATSDLKLTGTNRHNPHIGNIFNAFALR